MTERCTCNTDSQYFYLSLLRFSSIAIELKADGQRALRFYLFPFVLSHRSTHRSLCERTLSLFKRSNGQLMSAYSESTVMQRRRNKYMQRLSTVSNNRSIVSGFCFNSVLINGCTSTSSPVPSLLKQQNVSPYFSV